MTMRPVRRVALVTLATAALLAFSTPASAHSDVVSSTPSEGEVLTELPTEFSVTTSDRFLESGSAEAFALYAQDADGRYFGDGCVTLTGRSMAVLAALGEPGPYQLVYRFVSADGHTVSGEIAFEWSPEDPTDVEPAVGTSTPTRCGEAPATGDPSPEATGAGGTLVELDADLLWAVVAVALAGVATALILRAKRRT